MLVNNHTAIWGSWYDPSTATWGYACCHSIVHLSYCSGSAGIEAAQASSAQHLLTSASTSQSMPISSNEPVINKEDESLLHSEQNYSKKRVGEGDVRLDKDRLTQALLEEKKRKLGEDFNGRTGKKRRGALESSSHDVTEEELGTCYNPLQLYLCYSSLNFPEAYRMTRRMAEDPMANYIDSETA